MKKLTPKNKTLLGYTLYGILLTLCLLYIMFPADIFKEYLIGSANKANPRFRLDVEDAKLSLPFGVKFQQADLFSKENPDIRIFSAESLRIRPEIWSFLKGHPGFVFDCDGYGGNLRGHLWFSKTSLAPPFSASVKLKDISIEDYDYLSLISGRNSSGILGGTVTYDGLTDGTGEANLKVADGSVELREPFFNIDFVEFDELLIKLVLKDQKIDLSHVKLKGRDIQGTLSGTIRLNMDFMRSSLDLNGTIEISGNFLEGGMESPAIARSQKEPVKLPFVIQGTIRDPKFRLT